MSCHDEHPAVGAGAAVDVVAATAVLFAHRSDFVEFVASRVGDRATAEDLVQDALVRAVEKVADLREGDALLGWFYTVLRNAVVDHYRRRSASARALERLAQEPEPVSPDAAGRPCQCVSHVATTLKPEYAEALQRVEVEGTPVKDLAAELGITPGNAAVRVFRARESLRKKVMTTCKACAEAGCADCTCGQGNA
jgi:RNA polymerase sigma factor (sigma-70 family)